MLTVLTNSYYVAVGIPMIFLLAGAVGKKLVRGAKGWSREDFYLGTELTLGALSASLIHVFDLLKKVPLEGDAPWPPKLPAEVATATGFIAVCFFAFIWILSTHQDWHNAEGNDVDKQRLWLGGFCNAIGIVLMFAFVLGVKGVS